MTRLGFETHPARAPLGAGQLPVRGAPPATPRPRSPRVRDRWDRMRRPNRLPPLERLWEREEVQDDQAPALDWLDACRNAYGPGQWFVAEPDHLGRTRTTYQPNNPRRTA